MIDPKKALAFICIGSGLGYLYFSKNNKSESSSLKGLDINVKPEILIDSAVRMSSKIPEQYKDSVSHYSKRLLSGLIGKRL